MIPEQANRAGFASEFDGFATVGAIVHEIAEEDNLVAWTGRKAIEEFGKFSVAAVDVADCDVAVESQESGVGR